MCAVLTSLLVVVVGSAVIWHTTDGLQVITAEGARRAYVAHTQPMVPNAGLETMTETSRPLIDETGRITVVEFIYTRCPTICQTAGTHLARLRDHLKSTELGDHVRILSVSFDPAHDDVIALSSYGKSHGADGVIWTVARPTLKDLTALLTSFGVIVIPDNFGGYQHNAAIHVVSGSGRLIAILDVDDLDGAIAAIRGAMS